MGPAGYVNVYAGLNSVEEYFALPAAQRPELPFDEFLSYSDKNGKKAISYNAKNSGSIITTHIGGSAFTAEAYAEYAGKVANHYLNAVSSSYSICSQLVFASAEILYHSKGTEERYNRSLKACVVAWRLLYEGLGLAGWSQNATQFFSYLNAAGNDYGIGRVKVSERGVLSFYSKADGEVSDSIPVLQNCLAKAGAHTEFATKQLVLDILRSQGIVTTYSRLEAKGKVPNYLKSLETVGVIYGTLRRIGQGADPVEVQEIDPLGYGEEGQEGPKSLLETFTKANLGAKLSNPYLNKVSSAAAGAHTKLRRLFAQALTSEAYGM